MSGPIFFAYGFDGDGGAEPLVGDAVARQIRDDKLAWVHMDANHPDTRPWLETELSYLDPFIVEALLAEETRPRMTQIGDGVLLILRGVNLNENAAPEDMVSIRLWADPHRIVSLRKRRLRAIEDIEDRIRQGRAPKDVGQFLTMLASGLFRRMEPSLTALEDEVDAIEEALVDSAEIELRESISRTRKRSIIFRRYMAPQRDAISQLCLADLSWMSDRHRRHMQEILNHVTRYVEDLDAVRERAQIVKDEHANILANRLNRNMYVLSVIAAVFLPLGFLTGLLGVNVGGIPGASNIDAFWIFCAILVALVAGQVYLFRRLKWF